MASLEKKWLIIQAYKHNEELHREWTHSYVLEDSEDYFVLASIRAAVVESDGRKWHTKEPAIFILSKKKWFNVIAMFKETGICYYVNIASPAIFDKGFIKYIDYDLDAKLFPDKVVKVLDEKEYKRHRKLYGYDEDLNTVLRYQTGDIVQRMKEGTFPFVDEKINKYYESFLSIVTKKVQ